MNYPGRIARQRRAAASLLVLIILLALLAASASPSWPAEYGLGLYPLGYQSTMAGYQPPPGFYLRNDLYFYQGNSQINSFGRHIEVDLRNRLIVDLIGATYVTPLKIFGAHYAFGVIWSAVANNFLKGTLIPNTRFPAINRRLGKSQEGSYTGVSDLVVTPINLGWHLGPWNIMAFGNFYTPVGAYNGNRRLNSGLGRWAVEPDVAVTWLRPGTKYPQEASISMGYTINFEDPATQYTTGQEFHLEYFLGQHLPMGFTFGLAGYFYNQMTADTGSGAVLGAFHGQTVALGPCLAFNQEIAGHAFGVNVRYYNELKVRNRFDGQVIFLTLNLGL